MKTRTKVIPIIIVLTLVVMSPYVIKPASAHVTKQFGDISVKVGFANEPPLVGDTNTVQIFVSQGSGNSTQPIAGNALNNVAVTIQYGGKTKTLSFDPSDDNPGEYDSTVIPTQLGSYNIIMKGTINNQNIDVTFPLTDVESKDKYYFPALVSGGAQTTGTSIAPMGAGVGNGPNQQVGNNVIAQLTSDINDAKNMANATAQSYAKVAQSFQDVKNTTDTLYIISLTGVGIGAAGVVIAVMAISRKS